MGIEHALRQVAPGRFDTFTAYETLLRALGDGQVWMLLWQGQPGSPDAQYGNVDVDGHGYAPCVTSAQELAASGWTRSHEIVTGRAIAAELYRERWGLWLNPHTVGGSVGIPWLDLRRVAIGLDHVPAGPLTISQSALCIPQFYTLLTQTAYRTPVVRTLRAAWVQPMLGEAFLALGVELYDNLYGNGPQVGEAVRAMVQHAAAAAPAGLPLSTVAMADEYDPIAMWMRAFATPFFDRNAYGTTGPLPGAAPGPVPPRPSVPPLPPAPLPGGNWPTA